MSIATALRADVESLLAVLFPPRCGACREAMPTFSPVGLCEGCHEVLECNDGPRCACCDLPGGATDGRWLCPSCEQSPPPLSSLRAPFLYGGPLAELVTAAKFAGREDLAAAMAHLVWTDPVVRATVETADALIPIPLGKRRRRQRGYNQSAIIARALGRRARRPVRHGLLERVRDTAPQSDLDLEARAENVADAFSLRRVGSRVESDGAQRHVVLIDDVVTSGSTLREAAKCLALGGFLVSGIAVARTEDLAALSR